MRGLTPPDPLCERARCVASLRLDGETTELEEAFLASHLEECSECLAHVGGLTMSTYAIRSTPLAEPVPLPAFARRPRRAAFRHLQVATAALVVVGAGLTGLAGMPGPDHVTSDSSVRPAYLDSAAYEQRFIRLAQATRPTARWPGLNPRPS